MEQKLLFFDVDGTLVPDDWELAPSPAVCRALAAARAAGHRTFLCTGRTLCDIGPELRSVGFDGMITGGGAYISLEGRCIFHQPIPITLLRETVDRIISCGIAGVLSGPEELFYAGYGSRTMPWPLPRLKSGAELTEAMKIEKFTLRVTSPEELEPLRGYLEAHYEVYSNDNGRYYEMVVKGCNKANAMKRVCRYLGIGPESTVAFGDSENDLPILNAAGFSVAMGSAPAAVKAGADYVTDTVEADGVAKALIRLGFAGEK